MEGWRKFGAKERHTWCAGGVRVVCGGGGGVVDEARWWRRGRGKGGSVEPPRRPWRMRWRRCSRHGSTAPPRMTSPEGCRQRRGRRRSRQPPRPPVAAPQCPRRCPGHPRHYPAERVRCGRSRGSRLPAEYIYMVCACGVGAGGGAGGGRGGGGVGLAWVAARGQRAGLRVGLGAEGWSRG